MYCPIQPCGQNINVFLYTFGGGEGLEKSLQFVHSENDKNCEAPLKNLSRPATSQNTTSTIVLVSFAFANWFVTLGTTVWLSGQRAVHSVRLYTGNVILSVVNNMFIKLTDRHVVNYMTEAAHFHSYRKAVPSLADFSPRNIKFAVEAGPANACSQLGGEVWMWCWSRWLGVPPFDLQEKAVALFDPMILWHLSGLNVWDNLKSI